MPSGSMIGDQCAVPATRPNAHARCRDCDFERILPFTNSTSVGQHVELLGGDARELVADALGGDVGGDRGARREAAGIGARRDRPVGRGGVELQVDLDVLDPQAQLLGDDLREHGLVALAAARRNRPSPRPRPAHRRGRWRATPRRSSGRPSRALPATAASRDSPCSTSPARRRRQSRCRSTCRPCARHRGGACNSSSRPPPVASSTQRG